MESLTRDQLIERIERAEARTKEAKALIERIKRAEAEAKEAEAKEAEALIERIKRAEAEAKEAEARAEKAEALTNGTYYATIYDVVGRLEEDIPQGSLSCVRRPAKCDRFYKTAIEAAESADGLLRP